MLLGRLNGIGRGRDRIDVGPHREMASYAVHSTVYMHYKMKEQHLKRFFYHFMIIKVMENKIVLYTTNDLTS